jgi:hypothetical protein
MLPASLGVREGPRQIPLVLHNHGDVTGAAGDVGVVGAVSLFVDHQRATGVPQGASRISLVSQSRADVAGVGRHLGMVRAVEFLGGCKGALQNRGGNAQLPTIIQAKPDIIQQPAGGVQTYPKTLTMAGRGKSVRQKPA